ncbi:DNA replication/repair protein RecF [Selenomonas flueggei]|uniref:DNA replication and repair protein RecF n=1 Tax=Selenomonas flueggei ATCC 43531 TaxID=638302 RepID=C4V1P7_9FIRM|nr:DNA replication/repair protein RecF [Selenomonas flueggei]EEQ49184.1 DNA replication and repair protein RecF [Selenomonas flueggei ATCC 43531]
MQITELTLRSYRSYETLHLAFDPGVQIFLGANAQGKTNIIEALYYAAFGRSHRTSSDAELIRVGADGAHIALSFRRHDVPGALSFTFARGARRRIEYAGESLRQRDLVGILPMVLFSPEDLFLVKGAPALRRRYLDAELSQASPAYYGELLRYTRILKQRNAVLKDIRERLAAPDDLLPWDAQLAKSAAYIVTRRTSAVAQLGALSARVQSVLAAGEELTLVYDIAGAAPESGAKDDMTEQLYLWYNKMLREGRARDIARAATGVGPHLDDLVLRVGGMNLRSFGSQGQQRTGALALKLAELFYLQENVGEAPILLLDDVMSELDADRRRALLDFIRHENIQTFITATDAAYFPAERMGTYRYVEAGKVRDEESRIE